MYYLGVDIGGTNISVGIIDESGKLMDKASTPTMQGRDYHDILGDAARLCISLLEKNELDIADVHSVGVGLPGLVDKKSGCLVYANNLSFDHINVIEEMKRYIDKPIFIENDANCAAIGEMMCGAAHGDKNVIYITLGTGVGAGIILNGKLFKGAFGGGGEAGHMVIMAEGEMCTCGRKGCWEAYASATALRREGRIAAAKYPNSEIYNLVDGNIKLIDAKTVFDAADLNDEVALDIVDTYSKHLAIGLVNLVNIFQPETIVIGGGICARGDRVITPVTQILKERVYGGELKTKLAIASLGNDAGIVGAALLYKDFD
jgi:glucokinase